MPPSVHAWHGRDDTHLVHTWCLRFACMQQLHPSIHQSISSKTSGRVIKPAVICMQCMASRPRLHPWAGSEPMERSGAVYFYRDPCRAGRMRASLDSNVPSGPRNACMCPPPGLARPIQSESMSIDILCVRNYWSLPLILAPSATATFVWTPRSSFWPVEAGAQTNIKFRDNF